MVRSHLGSLSGGGGWSLVGLSRPDRYYPVCLMEPAVHVPSLTWGQISIALSEAGAVWRPGFGEPNQISFW